jgi:WD40 repeat protein
MLTLIDELIRLLQGSEGKSSTDIQGKLGNLQALLTKLDELFNEAELAITPENISSRKQRLFFSHFLQYNHPKVNKAQQTLTQLIDNSTAGKILSITNLERLRRIIGKLHGRVSEKINGTNNTDNYKSKASSTVINDYLKRFIMCIETPVEESASIRTNDIDEQNQGNNLENIHATGLPQTQDESDNISLYLAIQLSALLQDMCESENVEAFDNQGNISAQDPRNLATPRRMPEPSSSAAHATASSSQRQLNTLSNINMGNHATIQAGNSIAIGTQYNQYQTIYQQFPNSNTPPTPRQQTEEDAKAIRIYNLVACLHKHYKDQIKIQKHTPTLTALKNYYVEQQYSLDITGTAPKDMVDHITTWLREPAPPTLLILGEAGGGKSLLTQHWEQRLWATLMPELHLVPTEQSREEYVRSQKATTALLYHQKQWWLSYQQGEKNKLINSRSLPPYPFVKQLFHQSYQSLQIDPKQRKKISQGIHYYWLCQQKSYLPIRIPLGDYNAETILNCINTYLETIFHHECLEPQQNDLFALRKAVRLLCLFDGFDEIKSKEEQFEENLYRSNGLNHSLAKALFTCRSQYFDNLRRSNQCFNSGNTEIAPKVYLTQFKLPDIQAYIGHYAAVRNLENKTSILASLTEHPYLKELLATPLLLNLYMESYTPGEQPRNRWELYQRLMQGLFQRQVNRSTCPSSTNKLEVDYEDASAELAFSLFVENIDVITKPTQRSRRSKKRWGNSPPATTPLANFFSSEEFQTQLRCGHPFKLTESGKYGFIHESFKEFFIAKYLLADLEDAGDDTGGYALESAQDTWNAKLLPNKPVILSFLREAIEAQTTEAQLALKTQLWRWVTLKTAEYSNCSANSVTLLVQLGECFSNKDLSGTYLLGAMLSGGMFDSTNFTDADCNGVNFSQAWLRRANFTNSDLSNTEWGEYPKLELKGNVLAIYSDATGIIQIATVHGKNIYLWCGATGKPLATLRGHVHRVICLSYSTDGVQLASGSYDSTIRLWNITRRCHEATLVGHTRSVECLSYSADGLQLASGSKDRTIRLWNLAQRCLEASLVGHTNGVRCLSYRADGLQLASGSWDSTIRLWNVTQRCQETTLEGHTKGIRCLSYSADGLQLASGCSEHTIHLWNVAQRCLDTTLVGHTDNIYCLNYSADGVQLASGSYDSTIRLWNLARRCLEDTLVGHTHWVTCLSYSTDGVQLASGSYDGTTRLWNLARRCLEASLVGHTNSVICLSYSAGGVQLASGSYDRTIRLWNLARRCQEDTLVGHTGSVYCLSYSADGLQLASGSKDRTIRLWNLARRCQEASLVGHTHSVTCLSYSADGLQLASGSKDRTIRLWNLARRCQEAKLVGHRCSVSSLSYSADGVQLASGGGEDSTIRLWNVPRQCQEAILVGHISAVSCLSYSADGVQLASGSKDRTIRLWNLARLCQEASLVGHTHWVTCLSYSTDGLQLASGSYDRTFRIWDPRKYVCLRILSLHQTIRALAWHEEHLALGCGKEIVHFQTPQSNKPEAWYAMWRVALSPMLYCNELKFSGAMCNDITRRLLCQYGGVDHYNNSVASATPTDCTLPANLNPKTLLKTAAVELANSKNEKDITPKKHKQLKSVKKSSSPIDDDNVTNTMPGTPFSLPPPTKGGGDCALHAALGKLSSGQYICNDVEQKRRALSKAVRTCVEHSELHRLVCNSIEALVMEGRDVLGANLQALRGRFHQFSNDNKSIQADAWQQFYSTLQHDEKVLVHVDNFVNRYIKDNSVRLTLQNISRLRTSHKEAFSTCLQEENNRALEILIHSIPSLRDAYQTYRAAMSVGFNWKSHIERAVIQDYANFIGTPGGWLLPSELHIIATVFEIRIDYYLTASSAVPDVFNPTGDSSVAVQFNGEDHYERRTEEANFPTTPSQLTQPPLLAPLSPTSSDTASTTAPIATPRNTFS